MTDPQPERFRRFPRRWVVPPALLAWDEPYEGYDVLDEVRSGLGLLLWQTARDAALWATTEPEGRDGLFAGSAREKRRAQILEVVEAGSPLEAPLQAILRLLDDAPLQPEELTQACQAISAWAGARGLPRTALAFAQSAALSAPDSPAEAYVVGLLARRNAEYRRADTWFRRTLGLARRARDWKYYGLACIGLGNLYLQRGDYPQARTWFFKSLRVARRHGLWSVRSMALHDLFCAAAGGGHVLEAEAYARRAFRAYGRRHPRLVRLAHDVARFWLLQGHYARALKVFQAVLPHIPRAAERRLVMSNLARAAAGLNDRLTFAGVWSDTWRLVDDGEDGEFVAEALNNLAVGAAALGDPDRGQMAAQHALRVAAARGESEQRILAEKMIELLRRPRLQPLPPPAPDVPGSHAEALATDLVTALAEAAEP
jgi:tetratricopeptide (TPR) repeat protein